MHCIHICMYVRMYVCMYVCMYVRMYVYVRMHVYACLSINGFVLSPTVLAAISLPLLLQQRAPLSARLQKPPSSPFSRDTAHHCQPLQLRWEGSGGEMTSPDTHTHTM